MSTSVQSVAASTFAPAADDPAAQRAKAFGALAARLQAMDPPTAQATMAEILDRSPDLAERLANYMALSPADQKAALAKMAQAAPADSIEELVAKLSKLPSKAQSVQLQRIAQQQPQLAEQLKRILGLPAERQGQAIAELAAAADPTAESAQGTSVAAVQQRYSRLHLNTAITDAFNQMQADNIAESARAQAAQIMQGREDLTPMAQAAAGEKQSSDQLQAFWMPSAPSALLQSSALSAYSSSVGAKGY